VFNAKWTNTNFIANYYISDVVSQYRMSVDYHKADDNTPITRRELVLRLLSTPTDKELRCQVNIEQ
jgi:hypothetical protein